MKSRIVARSFFAVITGLTLAATAQAQSSRSEQAGRDVQAIVTAMKKAEKASIDAPAPDFTLVDTAGKEHTLSDYVAAGKTVVLEWFNPQCPVVQRFYNTEGTGLSNQIEKSFADQGIVWLRINSGSEQSRTSGKEVNDRARADWHVNGPVLLDPDGTVGKAYGAKVTPEMYVISSDGVLRYHGYIKADRPNKGEEDQIAVADAIRAVLAGESVKVKETKAYGCSVKYARESKGRG
ncbi:MAG: thioredoxin family protein [Phycisphaerales bacterium]